MTESRPLRGKKVRFTWVDLCITVLLMALVITATWLAVSTVREARTATKEVTCCFTAADLPNTADGKISKGETLYLSDGTPLGEVAGVSYQRPDGRTLQLTVYLRVKATGDYGGYRTENLLLTAGKRYHLQNKEYGGWLLLEKITGNGGK